ncbi:MAG: excinuclease ABC subunit A, partial [Bacteroidetes bacterium]|nr:excinuclease ABC subunit A [Bacteroidota bacterium]
MPKQDILSLDPKKFIIVKGARVHNLKNINIAIPRNKLVVITGLSGSGKSSLAFDTLYAEGQRRYVESLSSYARQFLGRMNKPEVDYIKGISPAIAVEQKIFTQNPRSTLGTSTEIYEYIKLLYARIGKTYSPISGNIVRKDSVSDVVNYIQSFTENTVVLLYSSIKEVKGKSIKSQLENLLQKGLSRVLQNGEILRIDELLTSNKIKSFKNNIYVVIDRFSVKKEDTDLISRIADSVETAFFEGDGKCIIELTDKSGKIVTKDFSKQFECDGITFEEATTNLFSFNNPFGACKKCEGFGSVIGIDEDLVIPNKSLSVFDDAIVCWRGEKMSEWKEKLVMNAFKFDFPIHRSFCDLTYEEKNTLWIGNKYFDGLNDFFKYIEEQTYKIQYRVMLSRYRGKTVCPECMGTRLRKDANYVKVGGKSVSELVLMPLINLFDFFTQIELNEYEKKVSTRLLTEITSRLQFILDVGLGYLTLNRLSSTLSGGESQRINIA